MGKVLNLFDGLRSALTGTGTARDARTSYDYAFRALTQPEIAAAYSGSGLLRKICQIPALDMVREWRTWNGLEADQVAKVYAEEKRIGLVGLVRQAEVLRALGGGALIMGLPGDPTQPARPTDKLAFVHVVSRWHLTFAQLQDDATKPGFGEPEMWTMNTTVGTKDIHPSRVIPFRADRTASLAMPTLNSADAFWGESTVSQVLDAVKDSDAARAAFAALLHKAKTMRIGIPKLYEMVAAGEDQKVFDRLAILATAESMHNAVVFDNGDDEGKGGEAITDAEYNFAGAKDMLYAYGEFVAAISDIPATRLLGRAPEGMNASGDSQQKDWQKKVRAMQELDLTPCLDSLDPHLLAAAGASADKANASWDPLDTPSEKENAERFKTQMEAIDKLQATAAIPDEAFNRGVQSLMVEEGYLPELELALSELGDDERYGIGLPDDPLSKGGDPVSLGGGGADDVPPRLAANDAAPRPLYVKRELLNAADLVAWAKKNGFDSTLAAEDMHVTILYSRSPVDPMKMGETWTSEENGGLTIKPGGPRALERFNEGAVVLQFASWSLESRHREMVEAGGSHDWPEYLPHVTLSYQAGDIDLETLVPYSGELRFGPEIFEPLDLDWKSKIEEA
ncbi:MAG: hypothetical protein Unbinned273contig1001_75 [Prokaryotic dsDNA virus sp.]|nr:MAG: hypothetical protein Unbinned273contig1001_75 [Prokaryotic dsDNA virus sp.]|tara:strand:+ start:31498 stop:33366 length:1869 start_codon:yes stop_codon:yes gene_type:complete